MNLLVADIVERFYTFLWPMLRISGLLLTAPLFSQNAVNVRLRVLLALVLTWLVYPLHDWPLIDPTSAPGLLEIVNQIFIGVKLDLVVIQIFDGFYNGIILRGNNLSPIFPIYFISIVFWRIVRSR
jgi:flagellar biosynthesis protein FliR